MLGPMGCSFWLLLGKLLFVQGQFGVARRFVPKLGIEVG
jgi:hypothetical protein